MDEKKLTDEDIIKDIERSTGMPSYWKKIVLDLIHRLQSKNERIQEISREKSKAYYAVAQTCAVQEETIANQKAEIERLNKCVMSEEQVRKCCADIIQETRQQAVKDTAKEIHALAVQNWHGYESDMENFMLALKERYGVEVEW